MSVCIQCTVGQHWFYRSTPWAVERGERHENYAEDLGVRAFFLVMAWFGECSFHLWVDLYILEWVAHQSLQDSLSGIELPGSWVTHVLHILQINDSEVDGKRHWKGIYYCRRREEMWETQCLNIILFSLSELELGHHQCASSTTQKGFLQKWTVSS